MWLTICDDLCPLRMAEVKIKSAVDIGSGPKKHDDVEAQNLQKATVTDYVEETEDSEELGKVIKFAN